MLEKNYRGLLSTLRQQIEPQFIFESDDLLHAADSPWWKMHHKIEKKSLQCL